MKHLLIAISMTVAALTLGLAARDADAARLGAGKPAGMQRAAPTNATPQNAPANTAAAPSNAAAPTAAAGTPPKRNWMGPLAGLAAGLGIAALFSHLGMGAGLANFVMIALLAVVAVFAVRFIMGRMRGGASSGPQLAGAGAGAGGGGSTGGWQPQPAATPINLQRNTLDSTPALPAATGVAGASVVAVSGAASAPVLPGGMDAADFERLAKMVFIRLQAANDASNLDDLRKFTTPELFASLRVDLQDRAAVKQQTDVVQIDAKVVETARENGQDIVTVRFTGLIREAAEAGAEPFNELWHLVRAADGHGDWAIAGITPVQ